MKREIHLVVKQCLGHDTVESYTLRDGILIGKVKTTCSKYENVFDAVAKHSGYVQDMVERD